MRNTISMFVTTLVLVGCADSQLGATKALRFGLQLQYTDTTGFAPIARGQELKLAVQAPTKEGLLNDYAYLDSTLSITDPDGNAVPFTSSSKGKFTTRFTRTGAHVLTATLSDGKSDTLRVDVFDQAGVRLAAKVRSITTRDEVNGKCTSAAADDTALTLKKNQTLNASLVPVDASGAPLLGLLSLHFSGSVTAKPATIELRANEFNFEPTATGAVTLQVTDEVTSQVSNLTIDVETDEASCPAK